MYIVFVAAPIFCFLLWLRYGRDEKPVTTVEFYPPEGLSSGEIGYLADGKVQLKDMLSMILWWATQKLLVIEDDSNGKFFVRRICAIPAGRKSYEKTLWNALFYESECVDLSEPNIEFSMALKQAKRGLVKEYMKDEKTRLYTKSSVNATIVCSFILLAPLIVFTVDVAQVNASLMSGSTIEDITEIIVSLIVLAAFLSNALFQFGFSKKIVLGPAAKDGSASTQVSVDLGFLIALAIMIIIGVVSSISLDLPKLMMTTVSVAFCFFFTVNMRKRTEYYQKILGRILGFRNFLKIAKLDEMEMLFADDPQYYYKILPYAWVFGISDTWANKFKSMVTAPPDAYMELNDNDMYTSYMFIDELDRLRSHSTRRS